MVPFSVAPLKLRFQLLSAFYYRRKFSKMKSSVLMFLFFKFPQVILLLSKDSKVTGPMKETFYNLWLPHSGPFHRFFDSSICQHVDFPIHRFANSSIQWFTDWLSRQFFELAVQRFPNYYRFTISPIHGFSDEPNRQLTKSLINRITSSSNHRFTESPVHQIASSPNHWWLR